jgi:hypothetical protein
VRAAFLSATGGSAPATLGFSAVAPEWPTYGAAVAAPSIPAPESTLGSHPCVALSSAQVLPEWTTSTSPCNDLSANGDNPLNFLSHSRGSPHSGIPPLGLLPAAQLHRAPRGAVPSRPWREFRGKQPARGAIAPLLHFLKINNVPEFGLPT